jgi:hypothetical protein
MHHLTTIRVSVRALLVVCLVVLAFLVVPSIADACPTCKDAIAQNDPHHQAMVKGYFYSILFMMSMPFIVVGTFGSMAYLSIRRARQDSVQEGSGPSSRSEAL